MRWLILALFFGTTILNQIDRQTLSILAPTIQADLGVSTIQYSFVVQSFLVFYALGMFLAGPVTDRLGAKRAIMLFLGFWSVAQMATGAVRSFLQLCAARAGLALGEAGNYVAAPKAVSDWFPPAERGVAVGIYTSAGMLGAVIAPPLIAWSALEHGWRTTFFWTGLAGLLWIVPILAFYGRPPNVVNEQAVATENSPEIQAGLGPLVRSPVVWRLFAARLLTDPVWYFYLFWFAKYLQDTRGFTLSDVGRWGWSTYAAADVGSILGGVASGWLIKRGMDALPARLRVMSLVAVLAPIGLVLALHPPIWLTMTVAALVAFLHLAWLTNLAALMVDFFPGRILGRAIGLVGAGSAIGGALSSPVIGYLITYHSYDFVFVFLGLLHPLGWFALRPLGAKRKVGTRAMAGV